MRARFGLLVALVALAAGIAAVVVVGYLLRSVV